MTEVFSAVSGQLNEVEEQTQASSVWGHESMGGVEVTHTYNGRDIFAACQAGDLGTVILLWYKGVSVGVRDPAQVTPLHQAAYHGSLKICSFLLEQGAELNPINSNENTPIMWATTGGHLDVVKFLASKGADLNKQDNRGYTVLFHAVHTGQTEILHWLLTNYGASLNVHALDLQNHNLFQWAAYKGFLGTCRYLREVHNLDVEIVDNDGRTSLHWACREGHFTIVEYLLTLGVTKSIKHRDSDGMTPAEAAISKMFNPLAAMVKAVEKSGKAGTMGSGCEESTVMLALKNPRHLRSALYGFIFTPLLFFYVSHYVPVLIGLLLLPALVTVMPTIDTMLLNKGQPPVRAGNGVVQHLATGDERNLNSAAVLMAFQILLPYHFLTGGVGAYIMGVSPMAHNIVLYASGLGFALFLLTGLKRAGKPDLPKGDLESVPKISCTPGAFCYEAMERRALRSVYCPLNNRLVAGFEYFSVVTDNAIGDGNKGLYICWALAVSAWTLTMSLSTLYWAVYYVAAPNTVYTVCRVVGRMLASALPGGDPASTVSFFLSEHEHTALWLCYVAFIGFLFGLERLISHGYAISKGITHFEGSFPECVAVTDTDPQSVFVNGKSMFSKGSPLANFVAFLFSSNKKYNSISEVASTAEFKL